MHHVMYRVVKLKVYACTSIIDAFVHCMVCAVLCIWQFELLVSTDSISATISRLLQYSLATTSILEVEGIHTELAISIAAWACTSFSVIL